MATSTGIWTQHSATAHALGSLQPAPLSTSGSNGDNGSSDSSSSSSATISANDFLTLLVTELQNQDPTDQSDPNAYIDQLVQVNSLEQLIDINQNLSTVLGISNSGSSSSESSNSGSTNNGSGGQVSAATAGVAPSTPEGAPAVVHPAAQKTSALGQVQSAAANAANANPLHSVNKVAPGNLSVPQASSASRRVAHALGGRPRAQ